MPTSLTTRSSALGYVRGAVVSPLCIATAVFASCVGGGALGLGGAIGAFLAVTLLIAASTRYAFVRRHLDNERQARLRCLRENRRVRLLRPAGPVRIQQYFELRTLVEETEKLDAGAAARFELQDLLEHFAVLGNTHQRCLDALRLGGNQLPIPIPLDPKRSKQRREIQLRRMRHRDACIARIDRLAEELETIDELIRLAAQRIASPIDELDMEREFERRLAEIDELEAAILQLSA